MDHEKIQETKQCESTGEHIKDAINILQLLVEELTINRDDSHIIRTIGIVLKILKAALSEITIEVTETVNS